MTDLKAQKEHFEFGENWADYASKITGEEISHAEKGMLKLLPVDDILGKSFLDIGCGSGVHSLSALRLGATFVKAVDIDPASTSTTSRLLAAYYPGNNWETETATVFDLNPENVKYDIVYSWGVLHHTGAMYEAISKSADMVKNQGFLVLALYSKTLLCPFWKKEKRFYSKASAPTRRIISGMMVFFTKIAFALKGKSFKEFVNNYKSGRGMSFYNDIHDWLGGYPYESIHIEELHKIMLSNGFSVVREFPYLGKIGLFGSGCFEVVYKRNKSLAQAQP